MIFREATIADIPQMQIVRHAVKENRLSDPGLVTDAAYVSYLTVRGKGWVCEIETIIAGFAIADLAGNNIWALFVDPAHEAKGIGKALHRQMLDWYFAQGKDAVWLGTAPGTRAELFYTRQGWQPRGIENREMIFEMTAMAWNIMGERNNPVV
jgi:GNAT superfamily N-acetyltransferase